MIQPTYRALTLLAIASLLSACYMRAPKQEAWSNPQFEDHGIGKTIVLAISDSDSSALQYETLFVEWLLPHVEAGSLHASQSMIGKVEKEQLDSILTENQVKTIIVTHMIDGTQRDQVVTLGYAAAPYDNGYWGYYNYGYALTANNATINSFMEYTLETNVYDVESKQLVWSGRKSIYDDRSDQENMNLVIKNVVRDLEKRGMLK